MIDRVVLTNWRRFPRAKVSCDVVYGDRFQSWHSHTRDISLGGCRVVGYYPFPLGKTLSLKLTHAGIREHVSIVGRVVQLYGGAENSLGVVFQGDAKSRAQLEQWMHKVLATEPDASRAVSRMLGQIPLEAQLRRASSRRPNRPPSQGELAVLQRLDRSPHGVSLRQLRAEWGDDWERRAQVIFDLIAEGIVTDATLAHRTPPALRMECATPSASSTAESKRLMKQLEREYGPMGRSFAQQVETITDEVISLQEGASSHSGPKTPATLSWITTPSKKR